MDMGSRAVYFWHEATDAVAWDPPPGAQPRSKRDRDAAAADARGGGGGGGDSGGGGSLLAAGEAVPAAPASKAAADAARFTGGGAAAAPASAADVAHHAAGCSRLPSGVRAVAQAAVAEAAPAAVLDSGIMPAATAAAAAAAAADACTGAAQRSPGLGPGDSAPQARDPDADRAADAATAAAGTALLERAQEAALRLCGPAPNLVRLAVEAEVRLREWGEWAAEVGASAAGRDPARNQPAAHVSLSSEQDAAAAPAVTGAGIPWQRYRRAAMDAWARMAAALP